MNETKFYSPAGASPKKFAVPGFVWIALSIFIGLLVAVGIAGFFFVVKPAYAVMADVKVLQKDALTAQTAVQNRDLVALEASFKNLESDFNTLRATRDSNFGWAKNFKLTAEYYSDSDHFINAGLDAIDAGRSAVDLVKPFADAAGLKVSADQQPPQTTSLLTAFSTWISIMPKIANDSDVVLAKLAKVGQELAPVNTAKYPEKIGKYEVRANIELVKNTLVKVTDYAPDIKKALTIIPGLLGVGTADKRYMIIMQNDKEIRATGGFWTNYATFKVRNGLLDSVFTSKDMYSVDLTLNAIDAYFTFPVAPPEYVKYLKVVRLYARDANISPDFPTSVDKFMYFYNLAIRVDPIQTKPVDGVIAMDTQVIRELLQITGPVTVNGVTYTPDNVVLELEKIASLDLREQAGRKGVLGSLMQRMLINVFESDKSLWSKLIEKGVDLAMRKHIVGYSFDPNAQALLEKYNLAGRIVDPTDPVDSDYSFVVSTNLGGDKTNWFVSKTVDHSIAKENGKWTDTVKITYTYPQPAADFTPFVKRFRDWVRVYAPKGSVAVSVDGTEDGTTTAEERNKTYFTGYVELGPTETKTLTFKYTLPDGLIKDGGNYNLYIQKQPGIDTEKHTVSIGGKTQNINLSTDFTFSGKL